MSGSEIPYQLRPNKHIDRQLFVECLQKIGGFRPLENYVYASMSGRYLEDAKAIYAGTGIHKITSFEQDYLSFKRQEYNKPHEFITCRNLEAKEFVDDFSSFSSSYEEGANFIVWLDYADASQRLAQLQEFESLLSQMKAWDIARITLNANANTFGSPDKKLPYGITSIKEQRLSVYKSQLGRYPSNPKVDEMTVAGMPKALARSVEAAAKKSNKGDSSHVVKPLAVFSYNDSNHTMLTVTCIVLPKTEVTAFFESGHISTWPHLSLGWDSVLRIDVPVLSIKEKMSIDRMLVLKDASQIHANIGFEFDSDVETSIAKVEQYLKYRFYYPNFVRVDI